MTRLAGKVSIITGAASGIGAGTAALFVSQGARVVIADIDLDKAETLAERLRSEGGDAVALIGDIGSENSIKALVAQTVDRFGRLDVVVNNAAATVLAATQDGPLLKQTSDLWDRLMAINLRGPMLMCREAVPHMVAQGSGAIINICSNSMNLGDLANTAYACSKAGLATLTRYVAAQHGIQGVRCNAISPGYIPTKPVVDDRRAKLEKALMRQNVVTRGGRPDDIGWMAVYLASDEAGFVNGQVYSVDGGAQSHQGHMPDLRDFLAGT
ncbi:SDR family oxidoreductase [Brevundimonas vitis]|uniref:SDR family oxidoreductase n=1 Tax=Brevundimonas vitisensis TaxID=2800818 RepID=A0ABX7BMB7_9CAUL|nr:SDR family oxidoreductase [Brevundimonas vitisensis]QQQ17878.1 SDR family oxidoreductase [Brevundimonas vitisensis]